MLSSHEQVSTRHTQESSTRRDSLATMLLPLVNNTFQATSLMFSQHRPLQGRIKKILSTLKQ